MTDWRQTLKRQASFRGVPFLVENSERGGGRRVVSHEYPFRNDAPYTEDMGLKGRTFSVEGYVLGTEYIASRDALILALEQEGSGELLHPYHGSVLVQVDSFRIRESKDAGGVAQFAIEFRETSALPLQPTSVSDPKPAVANAADEVVTAVQTEFESTYVSLPAFSDSAIAAYDSVVTVLGTALDAVSLETQVMAGLRLDLARFSSNIVSLVTTPSELVQAQIDLLDSIYTALSDALLPAKLFLDLYDFDTGFIALDTTPNRIIEAENITAIQTTIQRLALAQAAKLTAEQTFVSYEDAVIARNVVLDLIDEQVDTVSDDVYPSMFQLRADFVKAVPGESSELPHVVDFESPSSLPSLVLAHKLYGNLDLESDLIARNNVRDPCVIIGHSPLKVLSND